MLLRSDGLNCILIKKYDTIMSELLKLIEFDMDQGAFFLLIVFQNIIKKFFGIFFI
jgi:hypothetical protein